MSTFAKSIECDGYESSITQVDYQLSIVADSHGSFHDFVADILCFGNPKECPYQSESQIFHHDASITSSSHEGGQTEESDSFSVRLDGDANCEHAEDDHHRSILRHGIHLNAGDHVGQCGGLSQVADSTDPHDVEEFLTTTIWHRARVAQW